MFHIFVAWKICQSKLEGVKQRRSKLKRVKHNTKTIVFQLKPNLNCFSVKQACTKMWNIWSGSTRAITEVKHLELNQSADGSNLLGSGKCCCRKVGTMGRPLWYLFALARCNNTFQGDASAAVEQLRCKGTQEMKISPKSQRHTHKSVVN